MIKSIPDRMYYPRNDKRPFSERPAPDLIIEGGIIVTMKEDESPISDAKVLIRNGRISEILKKE
ncbi:hypothetical protein PITCH_A1150073 [uncultured Desulfobacterium sp.]|uniref:Amidohydrolase 3 domain-containing protein n=1 Tax=uncultured Desulfobacterium sp. TaxID=201089 RepID=A0A445MRF8_9BACT|nr:hypothetical protein PITCH_A1150073 [uncultured Desulfobacterium sp.]